MSTKKLPSLSPVDKELLKVLLKPNIKTSSKKLAKTTGLPQTTVQRHRKRLEKDVLEIGYTLDVSKFGWHKVDFFVTTAEGQTDIVAAKIGDLEEVVMVGKRIGQQSIDLHIQCILRGNAQILQMTEKLKAMSGINDASWSEIVEFVRRKTSIPSRIIDQL